MKTRIARSVLLGVAVGILGSVGFLFHLFGSSSARLSDRLFLSRPADSRIVIIAIDDASLERIGRWPWSRATHATLVRKLHEAGVRVIGYDVNFPEVSTDVDDQALAEAIQRAGNVVLPIELPLERRRDRLVYDPQRVVKPIPALLRNARASGHSNAPLEEDGVVRRIPLQVSAPDGSPIPAFAYAVGSLAGVTPSLAEIPQESLGFVRVHVPDAPRQAFKIVSAADVIQGTADLASLQNAIVFIGATAHDLHDEFSVPTSRNLLMSGVEVHASFLDTLIQRAWLHPLPVIFQILWLLLMGVLLGLLIPRVRLRVSVLLALGLWFLWIGGSFVLFDRGYLTDLVWPTLVLFFGYLLLSIERLLVTERNRAELRGLFGRYVSPVVLESLLKDPAKVRLGGERRFMSVLFSDLRGFTTMSEGMTPETLIQVLNTYLTAMTDIVFEQKGVLDKYIGDAVMAFWNAPLDEPKHAERAARTALQMRDTLHAMNERSAFGSGLVLKVGMGIHSGDMIVGNVGSEARHDYTVIGDNVNLASRVEGLNKEYGTEILVTEAFAKELGAQFLLRKIDKVAVKGKKEAVGLYELLDLSVESAKELQEKVSHFEQALSLYFAGSFQEAESRCRELLERYPEDGPTQVLLTRITYFLEHAPTTDWNGAWVMTKK